MENVQVKQRTKQIQRNTSLTARKKHRLKRYIPLFIMMLPGLVYLFINNYLPMFGVVIAFKDITSTRGILGILSNEWSGFENFEFLFRTSDAWTITRNTILYNLVFIILGTVIAIALAILLNEIRSKFFSRVYQSLIILPALISMVIVTYLVYSSLSQQTGFMNKTLLPMLGLDPVAWYSEPQYWPFILTTVNIWKSAGFSCIIYFAAIVGISPDYYEAARLDGASKWQQIRYITLPCIKPVIIMLTILAVGKIFYSDFGLFYQVPMDSGMLYDTTSTIDTYVYRGLTRGDLGMTAAAGVYQSVVGFILVLVSNFIVRKASRENALF